MASSTLVDLVKIYANSTGTGAISLGLAVPGFRGVEVLGDARAYSYSIQQEGSWEFGRGTYLAGIGSFVRTPYGSSEGGAPINLQPNAQVAFVALSQDLYDLAVPGTVDTDALAAEIARATSAEAFLASRIVAAALGFQVYATNTALNADTTKPVGTFAVVTANNTFYRYTSGGWVVDASIGNALAAFIEPVVAAGIVNLTASGTGNTITVNTPAGGFSETKLYRITSPITSTGAVTINDRPLHRANGSALIYAGTLRQGGEVFFTYRAAGVVFRLFVASNLRVDEVSDLINNLGVPALRSDITLTREPYVGTTQKTMRGAFGNFSYTNGARSRTMPPLIVASVGNSHMVGVGAPGPSFLPGEQLRAALAARLPGRTVLHDNYAVSGSWCNQIGGQIDAFTRTPDIVLVGDPMNDGTANIMTGYEGFSGPNNTYGGYEAALEDVFTRLQTAQSLVVNLTGHQPHPTRALANGRFTVTPEVSMVWPVAGLIAFFLRIVFTASNQRISAYAGDVPFDLFNQFNNGTFGVGQYLLEFDPVANTTGAQHQVVQIDPGGTWVRVDGTIPVDKDNSTSVRQANFNNETQVWPPLSQAIVQRDYSGTGAPVNVSWRHWELAKMNRRVAARKGVITLDSDALFGRSVLTNGSYDTLYALPPGDDYHSDAWYRMLPQLIEPFADDFAAGIVPAGRIYA